MQSVKTNVLLKAKYCVFTLSADEKNKICPGQQTLPLFTKEYENV